LKEHTWITRNQSCRRRWKKYNTIKR